MADIFKNTQFKLGSPSQCYQTGNGSSDPQCKTPRETGTIYRTDSLS